MVYWPFINCENKINFSFFNFEVDQILANFVLPVRQIANDPHFLFGSAERDQISVQIVTELGWVSTNWAQNDHIVFEALILIDCEAVHVQCILELSNLLFVVGKNSNFVCRIILNFYQMVVHFLNFVNLLIVALLLHSSFY